MNRENPTPIGRFAPSPTGALHLGNLRTALASWLSAKARGGRWLVRIEDVDTARCKPAWAAAQLRDLEALGLTWDGPIVWQSQRSELYRAALDQLARQGVLYRCACSRKDLALLASAPHGDEGLRPYPGRCRAARVPRFVADALRVELPPGEVVWEDLLLGTQRDDPAQFTGDPVLHRRDGCFAYHLAVVVDDAAQGVTEIVRGADLREVTATQIRLWEYLNRPSPVGQTLVCPDKQDSPESISAPPTLAGVTSAAPSQPDRLKSVLPQSPSVGQTLVCPDKPEGRESISPQPTPTDINSTDANQPDRLKSVLPRYGHLGLVTAPEGTRLGKRAGATSLAALQARGVTNEEILGWLGWSLGCLPRPIACHAADLIPVFAWANVPAQHIAAPEAWV